MCLLISVYLFITFTPPSAYEPLEGRRHPKGLTQCLLPNKGSTAFAQCGMNGCRVALMLYSGIRDSLLITDILTALDLNLNHFLLLHIK